MVERPTAPITLGISECLLGKSVRYDGSDAAAELSGKALAQYFSFRGICPEVGIGMGVPRPPIGLYRSSKAEPISVLQVDNQQRNFTAALQGYAQQQTPGLSGISGYILMKNSPSCGLFTVKVHDSSDPAAAPERVGRGVYAAELTRLLPRLPVEENERLFDPELRHNFIVRAYAYAHWQKLQQAGLSAAGLVEFHSRYKYLLMAHSQTHYRQAGQLLSQLRDFSNDLAERYIGLLMEGLARPATRPGHVNVLQHLSGYLKLHASESQRRAVVSAIDRFAQGQAELQVPLESLHAVLAEHLDVPQLLYAWRQIYFEPYPQAR